MNKKNKKWFFISGFIAIYIVIIFLLVNNFGNIEQRYADMDTKNVQAVETALYDAFNNTPPEKLTQELQSILDKYPMEIVVMKNDAYIFSSVKLAENQSFRKVLNADVVAVESQGEVNGFFVWYAIYHVQDNIVFKNLLVEQNILIIGALVLLSAIILILQLYVISPLYTLRKSIMKINQYDFKNIEEGHDDINLSLNIFAKKMQNIIHAVSRNHTELEMELQIEREHLNNTIVVSRALVHNLKTPVYQSLLDNEGFYDKKATQNIETITLYNMQQNDKVLNEINDILKLLKTDFYSLEQEQDTFNLVQLLSDTIQLFEKLFREHEVFLNLDMDEALIVTTNQMTCQLLLHNILSNAINYANKGSEVLIKIYDKDNDAYIEVQNESTYENIKRMKATEQIFNVIEEKETKEHVYSSGNGLYLIENLALMIGGQYQCLVEDNQVTIQIKFDKGGWQL